MDVDAKIAELYMLRKTVRENQERESRLRQDIISYMKSNNKKFLKLDDYSVELQQPKLSSFNKDMILSLHRDGKLPADAVTFKSIDILKISSSKDMKLDGIKFRRN